MYNFIFSFFYRIFEWRMGLLPSSVLSFTAASIVGFTITIHVGLAYALVRYFTGFHLGPFSYYYGYKLILLLFILAFYFLVYWLYYRRRGTEVVEKYYYRYPIGLKTILYIILIQVVPLIGVILLAKFSIRY